ncbi:MAG: lysophospholipid acyltransferase family protein [Alphaproteobacteria bacterium]|nr:lysophospholipid acyltransferase family protein [Alphaproteobacteria bacterium]MDE1986524.1 lysophospholipid acyltransferase family protein [Alphaproteobacteria bacterium]MDE2163466.1 lysophospholipid acyltransferase family protein [Alphaproteobacteria bacterium]MDE2265502.1 lysophospholipid acyltransferase family protein [Alphaproteobacteria bacterium]MDE2500503.1 lysophospholipid acyltransferase family protein [Alphaproteobacteria bacterium]
MSELPIRPLPFAQRLRYSAESVPFFLFMGLFKILGIDAASAVGSFIGRHVFYRLPPARTARTNLRAAYPDMSAPEIEKTVREVCDNLGRVVAEYPHLDKLALGGPGARIEMDGVENGNAAVASAKGVMFISGHFANWETMPVAASLLGYDGGLVYRPPNNPYVDRWISRQRAKLGPKEQISKGVQGTRRIFTLLRRGKAIFLLVDQKTGEGISVPFFGRGAMTTAAPAMLALKLGSILLPASAERVGGAHFRVKIHPPIEFAPSGDYDQDVPALTAKITETIEAIVRERPSQWLWIHHRWPRARDVVKKAKKRNGQDLGGSGVSVEREGSSLT